MIAKITLDNTETVRRGQRFWHEQNLVKIVGIEHTSEPYAALYLPPWRDVRDYTLEVEVVERWSAQLSDNPEQDVKQ